MAAAWRPRAGPSQTSLTRGDPATVPGVALGAIAGARPLALWTSPFTREDDGRPAPHLLGGTTLPPGPRLQCRGQSPGGPLRPAGLGPSAALHPAQPQVTAAKREHVRQALRPLWPPRDRPVPLASSSSPPPHPSPRSRRPGALLLPDPARAASCSHQQEARELSAPSWPEPQQRLGTSPCHSAEPRILSGTPALPLTSESGVAQRQQRTVVVV